jgi:hypothetical protein
MTILNKIKNAITITPSTIRYQPKALKSLFLMYLIRNLIAIIETIKAENHTCQQYCQFCSCKVKNQT